MFTAIIAENEYIEKISEYQLFLKPFLDSKKVVFCPWNPEHTRLADMIPSLFSQIGRRKEWRAVIICDESGLEKKNPFDLVSYEPEKFDKTLFEHLEDEEQDAAYEAFLQKEHEKKLSAYDEAATKPLTRLVTHFCEGPMVTQQTSALGTDPDYERYRKEVQRKEELRRQIIGDEVSEVAMPSEIICISKRTCSDCADDLEVAWTAHSEIEYSRFYDRNMYFDKMRYLAFDILPRSQRDYAFDYIRFLYVTILLASNEIPTGALNPNRVYRLACENDERALRELLFTYEAKLDLTREMLVQRVKDLKAKRPKRLTDREAEKIFCAKVNVPVTFGNELDTSTLFVSKDGIGFANGCPAEEEGVWDNRYRDSKKTLQRMLKQTHRSLKRAATDARAEDNVDLDLVGLLNEFQLDDVKEHIDKEELAMIATHTPNFHNEEAFVKPMETEDKAVRNKIKERMYRNTTIAVGAIGVFAFLLGFFTLFFVNASSNAFNFTMSLLLTVFAAGAMILVAGVGLFFLRRALISLFKRYNWVMHGVRNDIDEAMVQYSLYLSHMCNVRRGFSVLNTAETQVDPDLERIVLYNKHIMDMEVAKAEMRDVFGQFMVEAPEMDLTKVQEYDFNFDRPTEYIYPIPYTEGKIQTIEFLQAGIRIEVPVDFVKSITIRREELYD